MTYFNAVQNFYFSSGHGESDNKTPNFKRLVIKGRSTSTNLLEFTSQAIEIIESGSQIDIVFKDFHKAFDRVSHELLLDKLRIIGVEDCLLG